MDNLEVLERVYKDACKRFQGLENSLNSRAKFMKFLEQEISEIVGIDSRHAFAQHLRDRGYYMTGVQYYSRFFPEYQKGRIYLKLGNRNSDLYNPRDTDFWKEFWKKSSLERYKGFRLFNYFKNYGKTLNYLHIRFTPEEKKPVSPILNISYSIIDKLHKILVDLLPHIENDNFQKVEELLKKNSSDPSFSAFLTNAQQIFSTWLFDKKESKLEIEEIFKIIFFSLILHIYYKEIYKVKDINSLIFPIGYGAGKMIRTMVFLAFYKELKKDDIYFFILGWRNLLQPVISLEDQCWLEKQLVK